MPVTIPRLPVRYTQPTQHSLPGSAPPAPSPPAERAAGRCRAAACGAPAGSLFGSWRRISNGWLVRSAAVEQVCSCRPVPSFWRGSFAAGNLPAFLAPLPLEGVVDRTIRHPPAARPHVGETSLRWNVPVSISSPTTPRRAPWRPVSRPSPGDPQRGDGYACLGRLRFGVRIRGRAARGVRWAGLQGRWRCPSGASGAHWRSRRAA